MLELVTGNLLGADTEALVNTVNTEGVMGKGVALQFKKKYPEMFARRHTMVVRKRADLDLVSRAALG